MRIRAGEATRELPRSPTASRPDKRGFITRPHTSYAELHTRGSLDKVRALTTVVIDSNIVFNDTVARRSNGSSIQLAEEAHCDAITKSLKLAHLM